ncbi:FGGY-family carbohydrate kinase [Natronolimnohabitans innermongolicus]|uniref:Sugar kinase n=1 Tax=Natronolimnohabitans innermongolicus JCM 12255 TaxID=1227499 RepID=L9XIC7_9EURY|nr:FGGY-family carbohydrate kinase [Natronolimnohabitans innermongolicus]ELY61161.1 sugar kinase [Natronolimnohabitans innermongolicus JCM 12255]
MSVYLGVDAGTRNVKAVAYDLAGRRVAMASEPQSVLNPASGRAEQDMAAVWSTVAEAIRSVTDDLEARGSGGESAPAIEAVGLTGQGDGCWLVDVDGEPVRNAVLWSDSRAAGVLEEWAADGTLEALVETCGSRPYPGMGLPVLRWLADEEPESLEAATTAFSCTDWLAFRLTGDRGTDYTEATVPFLNRETESVEPAVFERAGLADFRSLLPPVRKPTDVVGRVTAAAAEHTGLPVGTPVVTGAIDVVASAIGNGAVRPGDGAASIGTSIFTQVIGDRPGESETSIGMALGLDGRWTTAIGSNAGTRSLEWVRSELADGASFDALEERARAVPAGSEGLLYLPYLSETGERGPFTDPNARAGFVGLSPAHGRAHLVRATYEGLALALRDCVEHLPVEPERLALGGGGARSTFFRQLVADCVGTEIVVTADDEPGANGAAMLAAVGNGEFSDLERAAEAMTAVHTRYQPATDASATYDDLYETYAAAREGLEPVWDAQAAFREGVDSDDVASR